MLLEYHGLALVIYVLYFVLQAPSAYKDRRRSKAWERWRRRDRLVNVLSLFGCILFVSTFLRSGYSEYCYVKHGIEEPDI